MNVNNKPCGTCEHFDVIIRGKDQTDLAWCAKKSVYPANPGPGQLFPAGVTRAEEPSELGKPVIVRRKGVVASCDCWMAKNKPSKEDLLKALTTSGKKRMLK